MAFETGGRADKLGNIFEYKWTVLNLLDVLFEKIEYVTIEAIGADERGVDLWIGNKDGTREGQQCKARNASNEKWDYNSIKARGVINKWKMQLERHENNRVSLVSPLAFTLLEDLIYRANTSINPKDFLEYQINASGSKTKKLFQNICNDFGLNPHAKDSDLIKIINYLSRISYRQAPNSELKNMILNNIRLLFLGEPETIYAEFINYLLDGSILGRELSLSELNNFITQKGIMYRNLDKDKRIMPTINRLNKEFRRNYSYFENGLIIRDESSECWRAILEGKSVIIHGKAGIGKSGCAENIIDYCEENSIPYLAIKLDKRIPTSTTESWANSMNLPASISSCLHSTSKNQHAVLILDQLDALRWTQAHSTNALDVCFQIIDEIKCLNIDRKEKISIVMVCRSYDYENDRNIASLFKTDDKDVHKIDWKRICVNNLSEEKIQSIIGKNIFNCLNKKLREIITIPSNLYIFEKLDFDRKYDSITTTRELINEWWKQLNEKASDLTIESGSLNKIKNKIVNYCQDKNRTYVPIQIIDIDTKCINFLNSNGFTILNGSKLSFAHQSILDHFMANNMMLKYIKGDSIDNIIGDIESQTPGKRYQVQMFMQSLMDDNYSDFVNAGIQILEADNIRFNIKYIFLELLKSVDKNSSSVKDFILKYIAKEEWENHICDNVVSGNPYYIHILRENSIFDEWMNGEKRLNAIELMASISGKYTNEDITWISNSIFANPDDENEAVYWSRCFYQSICYDSDEFFELRINFYRLHPNLFNYFFDLSEMINICELRAVRMLALWVENEQYTSKNWNPLKSSTDFYVECNIKNYSDVIKIIKPLLPKSNTDIKYSNWENRYMHTDSPERACIKVLKSANKNFVKDNPDEFINTYRPFFSQGNILYNEIILDAFMYFPASEKYADFIITYLYDDFDMTLLEGTSGNENRLEMAKRVIGKYSVYCSDSVYNTLEYKINIYSNVERMLRIYKNRIDYYKENGIHVFWRFWGDLQKELLPILPPNRKSHKVKDLERVLNRKIKDNNTIYFLPSPQFGSTITSITNKCLSFNNWKSIFKSTKLKNNKGWREIGTNIIENNIRSFSNVFYETVSKNTIKMIKFMLELDFDVDELYIDALYKGISYSNTLDDIDTDLIEKVFKKYPCDNNNSSRALEFCEIILKKKNASWSMVTLETLKNLAQNHIDPQPDTAAASNAITSKTVLDLETDAINCVRGAAAHTIANVLLKNSTLFDFFRRQSQILCKVSCLNLQDGI